MTGRGGKHRLGLAGLAAAVVALAIPSQAGASTPFGQTFDPSEGCTANTTVIQSASPPPPAAQYGAPSAGVITSWNHQAGASAPPQLKLKVARLVSGDFYLIVGESALEAPVTFQVGNFPARIPVQAGDVLGYFAATSGLCAQTQTGYPAPFVPGDPAPGTTLSFPPPPPGPGNNFQLDLSAVLEPDADGDGFGDESQDQCPDHAGPDDGCDRTAPDVQIVSGPPAKTTKTRATFEFTGTDARVISGFQCKLDAAAFASCTSPYTVKVKKGKHTFQVRAIDQGGNVDGSPATDTWKVKKKKKKK